MVRSRLLAAVVAAVGVVVASTFGGPPAHAADDHTITLTFVRHARSAGNASGVIDTSTAGPNTTDEGRGQAEAVAVNLSANHYDGIFASSMVRTHETAAPMAQKLGEPVTVLPGLREIEARQSNTGYVVITGSPKDGWTLTDWTA